MNKKRFRQITAWLLLLLLAFAGGCGKGKAPASESASPSDNPGEVNTEGEKEQSMGRYLEYQIELPEEFEYADSWGASAIQTLESGEIALLEESMGLYVSADKGKTWEQRSASWLTELSAKEAYIPHLALAPDGSAAAIYSGGEDEAEEERFRKLDAAIRSTRKAKRFHREKKEKKEKDSGKLIGKEKKLNPNLTV